jgi:hypothetical protein
VTSEASYGDDALGKLMDSLASAAPHTVVAPAPARFVIADESAPITVHLAYSHGKHGTHRSVLLSAPYPATPEAPDAGAPRLRSIRPMQIFVRREQSMDVLDKDRGIVVEAQTGDSAFDDAFFIDSPADPELVQKLLGPVARDAITQLLSLPGAALFIDTGSSVRAWNAQQSGFHAESVEPRSIVVLYLAGPDREIGDPATTLIDAMRELARALPPVEAIPGTWPAPRGTRLTQGLFATGAAAFVGLLATVHLTHYDDPGALGLAATCASVALGAMIGPLLARPLYAGVRGTSSAGHLRRLGMLACALLVASLTGIATAIATEGVDEARLAPPPSTQIVITLSPEEQAALDQQADQMMEASGLLDDDAGDEVDAGTAAQP